MKEDTTKFSFLFLLTRAERFMSSGSAWDRTKLGLVVAEMAILK